MFLNVDIKKNASFSFLLVVGFFLHKMIAFYFHNTMTLQHKVNLDVFFLPLGWKLCPF